MTDFPIGWAKGVSDDTTRRLRQSDPSMTSVASVAYHWGFTNLGRFAAAHTARYDGPPAATLRRLAYRGIQSNVRHAG
jgi:hypothetical protein